MKRQDQQGMTTISVIIVIAIFGMIILTGFKILPMYMEYYQVKSVLDSIAQDPEIDPKSKKDIRDALWKRLYVNSVRDLKQENFTLVREDGVTTITADYEVRKPYVAQLFIGAHFVYSVEITR